MSILVTGGAGYIGSVTVELLRARGAPCVVLDNLSRGHRAAVTADVPFYQGDISDAALVARIVRAHDVEACIHFAAYAYVGESVAAPGLYFTNNAGQSVALIEALQQSGVRGIIFSSTCATYGEPERTPLSEAHPQRPVNPYGWSKFMVERVLESYDAAYGLRFVALRYFNAAGATQQYGEDHSPETHLIPNVLAAAQGKLPAVAVFGRDYPTRDGTCVRDYIHVSDLGAAHIQALDYLRAGGASTALNLGNGVGFSVLEIVESARRVTGRAIEVKFEPRRAGDPAALVADAARAGATLGWQPRQPHIDEIIETAWAWHEAHPRGYAEEHEE